MNEFFNSISGKNTRTFIVYGASGFSYSICREQFDDHLVQEWRFFVKSEQSYKFFSVFQKVRGRKLN